MNKSIIIIVSFSLVLIFGIVSVWPKYQNLRYLEQEIEMKEKEISRREERIEELERMTEELKNYQNQLAKIDSALPPEADLPALFDFLQKASSQSGLVLKSISHLDPKPSPDFAQLKESEVSLTVSGVYASFKNFLSVLEVTARLIEAQSISFSSMSEEGPREFKLTIKVYSYAQ